MQKLNTYMRLKSHYMTEWYPHLIDSAVSRIENHLNKNSDVFETGSGSSTIWFAKKAASVISYESNKAFFDLVNEELKREKLVNVRTIFDPDYPKKGITNLLRLFDIILIDGRGRVKSIETTIENLKPGGLFVLDDSQRQRYRVGRNLLDSLGWKRFNYILNDDHFQPPLTTTIWEKGT